MKSSCLLLMPLLLATTLSLRGQTFNRPVPGLVPPYAFVEHDSTYQGYYLLSPFLLSATTIRDLPLMILDSRGYLLWYALVRSRSLPDFKYNPEAQLYQFTSFINPQQVQFLLMDTDFNLVDSFTTVNGVLPDIHDFLITAGNTYLLSGVRDTIVDLSNYQFGNTVGSPATRAVGFVVQEFDAAHNLIWQWNSNEHIHPGEAYSGYGYNPGAFDYCHGNSIEVDYDGHLLISFRHLDAVYKIHRETGEVLWQLGGKFSSFSFSNDFGFSGQHDARRLPNGHISVFDNANMAAAPNVSRAVEYALDTVNWVATRVWEYGHSPGFFAPSLGNHQTTTDRRHLVHFGFVYRPNPNFVLVDDDGQRLAELFFQDSVMSYRAFLHTLPFDMTKRPAVQCAQNNGEVTLSAPPGYDRYVWSTGENTATITVQNPGEYQVWVPHGIGFIGSEPVRLSDLATACPVSSTTETEKPDAPTILEYYDLLGRRMEPPQRPGSNPQIYVVRLSDGRMVLRQF